MRSWAAEDELRSLAAPAKNFASHVKAASPTMLPNPPPTHKHCPSGGFFYFAVSPNTGEHETKRFNPESWPEAAHDLLQFWDRCVQGPSLGFHPATAAAAAAKFACFPIFSSFLGLLACLACHLQIRRIFGAVFSFFVFAYQLWYEFCCAAGPANSQPNAGWSHHGSAINGSPII